MTIPTEGLSAHDAAMIAKVDEAAAKLAPVADPAKEAAPAAAALPQRPEHIPEKFWDASKGVAKVDEMAKSYAELERTRSQAPAPAAAAAADQAAADAKAAGVDTKGIDFATYSTEFATNGKLGDDSYKALEAAGIPKAVVDEYIASKAAASRVAEFEAREAVSEAHSWAGGESSYKGMLAWAAANLSAADQAAFDNAVVADSASRKQAITALRAQYTAARGNDPRLVAGEGQGSGDVAFQSRAEVTAAMRDPRYKADPAYRASVERRIGAMTVF